MSTPALSRLLAPRSIALIGGEWTDHVARACRAIGYDGALWRVHPGRASTAAQTYYPSVEALPQAPDAAFVAVPAQAVPAVAGALAARGAGGFVCFAAGFAELGTAQGRRLTQDLLAASGELPFFGPNCYGLINFFDAVALWPDQVVGERVQRGVALLCQSGTIALNLLFNDRSLPLGLVLTVGNQARLALEDLIEALCADPRVTAFGLYVEGIRDPVRFARAIERARAAGKPVALVKAGRSEAAARTAYTHTGALVGADAPFDAFCRQAGIARCESLATLCETLKLLHAGGPLPGRRVLCLGASGGDMAMTADAARHLALEFPPLPADSRAALADILSDAVALENPLDFQTGIWFDRPKLRAMFSAVLRAGYDAVGFMLDSPPEPPADASSYRAAVEELIAAAAGATTRAAVISSLPESLSRALRAQCLAAGVVPLQGQREALEALELAAAVGEAWAQGQPPELTLPARPAGPVGFAASARTLSEPEGKRALAAFGVPIPRGHVVAPHEAVDAAAEIGFPVAMKAVSTAIAHKSELGAVALDLRTEEQTAAAAHRLGALAERVLVEEMVRDGVAELLVGVSVDAQFGQVLVLGAGGVLTELLRDSVTLLPPFTPALLERALARLRIAPLLRGFRGKPAADVPALIAAALACAQYAQTERARLLELDINPLIVRPAGHGAVAADVLIRLRQD